MCDCYWPKCERCHERLPLHIGDFCMPRKDVAVFCGRHMPTRDVVVYELVTDDGRSGMSVAEHCRIVGHVRARRPGRSRPMLRDERG